MAIVSRLEGLRKAQSKAGIDAMLITELTNIRYLTGFTGSAAVLAVSAQSALMVTDGRYRGQAAEQLRASGLEGEINLVIGGGDAQREALLLAFADAKRVGLEADHLSWSAASRWQERLSGTEVKAISEMVEKLRMVKDAEEIAMMEKAAAIADAALGEVLGILAGARGPVSERAFALQLDSTIRRLGAEGLAFETIVAAGENSAKPHHEPSDRQIQPGDSVVVDFGAMYEGYRSDMTRSFSIGGPPKGEMAEVFAIVLEAQRRGVAAVKAGATTTAIDAACRDYITEQGYGDAFEHSTGHGVGLDIHEAPGVGAQEATTLEAGMVVTVEPGIYLSGLGGVRIEDTLVVTETGATPLTKFHKDVVL